MRPSTNAQTYNFTTARLGNILEKYPGEKVVVLKLLSTTRNIFIIYYSMWAIYSEYSQVTLIFYEFVLLECSWMLFSIVMVVVFVKRPAISNRYQ